MARTLVASIAGGLAWLATSNAAHPQQNSSYDPSTGISGRCVSNCDLPPDPGATGGSYTADQQAMLGLASNFGNLLGAAIRQSFIDGQRRAQEDQQRRAFEAEQARQRALAEAEDQRRRNAALLANMKGAVGAVDLQAQQVGGGQLKMRTAKDMFDDPAPAGVLAPGSWSAYYNVLQRRDAAAVTLNARESDLAVADRLLAEAQNNAAAHPGPELARLLDEARAIRDKALHARDAARADVQALDVKLAEAAAARDKALNVSANAGAQRGQAPTPVSGVSQSAGQTRATAPAGSAQSSTQQLASRLPQTGGVPGGAILSRGPQYSDPNTPAPKPGASSAPGATADAGASQQQEVFLGGVKPADAGLENASTPAPRPDDLTAFAESLHKPVTVNDDPDDLYVRQRQEQIVKTIAASARDWDAIERQRLSEALRKLADRDFDVGGQDTMDVWGRMYRSDTPETKSAATKGVGPAVSALGLQKGNDCALYALANASGRSYDDVLNAARAIIRSGSYRSLRDRPDEVIQNQGIYGEELVMLVEALGAVEIVQPAAFAETLRAGRAVMVSVFSDPTGKKHLGDLHQIVLSKTFEYRGATWFEVIDSNSVAPRYLSKADLDLVLVENGIVYRPEQRSPHLLQ